MHLLAERFVFGSEKLKIGGFLEEGVKSQDISSGTNVTS